MIHFKDKHERSLLIAISLGFTAVLFISFLVSGAFRIPKGGGGWIYEYQTLISAGIALLTIAFFYYQHRVEVIRKRRYIRAKMHDAISGLCNTTEKIFDYLYNQEAIIPQFNDEDTAVFKEAIQFVDPKSASAIDQFVSFLQVHNSRLSRYDHTDRKYYLNRMDDLIRLNHYVLRMFEYARGTKDFISDHKPTHLEMSNSLMSLAKHDYFVRTEPRFEELSIYLRDTHAE